MQAKNNDGRRILSDTQVWTSGYVQQTLKLLRKKLGVAIMPEKQGRKEGKVSIVFNILAKRGLLLPRSEIGGAGSASKSWIKRKMLFVFSEPFCALRSQFHGRYLKCEYFFL